MPLRELQPLITTICKQERSVEERTEALVDLKKLITRAYASELGAIVHQVMHNPGTVITLIHLMEHQDHEMMSAAIALISQLSLTHASELVVNGSISTCVRLLSTSTSDRLSSMAKSDVAFILGHAVSSSSSSNNNPVLAQPHGARVLSVTAALLQTSGQSLPLERSVMWLASCVCMALKSTPESMGNAAQVPASEMNQVIFSMIPHLMRRLTHRDEEIIRDSCRSLTGLIRYGGHAVVLSLLPVSDKLVQLAGHPDDSVSQSGLRLIGSMIALSNNGQVQKLMQASLLTVCKQLLSSPPVRSIEIRRDVCWIASNCATEREHISRMRESGLLKSIATILSSDPDCGVSREAAYCISHVAQCGELPIVRSMCESMNVIESLIRCLKFRDTRLILRILSGLSSILQVGCDIARGSHKQNTPAGNQFADRMQLAGGLDLLLILQSDPEERIALKADSIIRTYFTVARDNSNQCSPMWFHVARVDHMLLSTHRGSHHHAAEAAKRKRDQDR